MNHPALALSRALALAVGSTSACPKPSATRPSRPTRSTSRAAAESVVAGISVIDLNGFGQSTGSPTYDPTYTNIQAGDTNFPDNPNVKLQGSLLFPPLIPGSNTRTGGSSGVFTLTRNSALDHDARALRRTGRRGRGHDARLAARRRDEQRAGVRSAVRRAAGTCA
jgi:hypothetical protein